jgi:hypothetical protein
LCGSNNQALLFEADGRIDIQRLRETFSSICEIVALGPSRRTADQSHMEIEFNLRVEKMLDRLCWRWVFFVAVS